jgi:hypothetical protein
VPAVISEGLSWDTLRRSADELTREG